MRHSERATTLGQLIEAVTRASEDTADTGSQAKQMAERTLVDTLVRVGRADVIDQMVELATELEESEVAAEGRRDRRDSSINATVAA